MVFFWLSKFCHLKPSEILNYIFSLVESYFIAGSVTCSCLTEKLNCAHDLIIPYPFIHSHSSLVVSYQHCRISYKCGMLRTDDFPVTLKVLFVLYKQDLKNANR